MDLPLFFCNLKFKVGCLRFFCSSPDEIDFSVMPQMDEISIKGPLKLERTHNDKN